MVHLALLHRPAGTEPVILAGRNAHKTFLHACALLDVTPQWLYPERSDSLCAWPHHGGGAGSRLSAAERRPMAVYVTSPDYLGGMLDIAALSAVCRSHGIPLLVDNAHGAYLKFLPASRHPLDLGAALCCDSAHKTLPVLTGGAYLHIGKDAPAPYEADARESLALFGSSSPSYLILQSLDHCNSRLAGDFPARLAETCRRVEALKTRLSARGIPLRGTEPMKIVVDAAAAGLDGRELADLLRRRGVEPEYARPGRPGADARCRHTGGRPGPGGRGPLFRGARCPPVILWSSPLRAGRFSPPASHAGSPGTGFHRSGCRTGVRRGRRVLPPCHPHRGDGRGDHPGGRGADGPPRH